MALQSSSLARWPILIVISSTVVLGVEDSGSTPRFFWASHLALQAMGNTGGGPMERSSLFSICPSCRARARIQPTPGAYRCLSCNFDFASLAQDEAAMDRWMEENLRDGSFEMTITLHHLF